MTTPDVWPTWEAKARFSEMLRIVREGRTVTVTYHGEPVAEVRPLNTRTGIEARLERLRSRGQLTVHERPDAMPAPLATRPGALERFLEDRHG
ncbi:MAG: type II toxin-antitoxin system prevent-host-death family antitoxin [Longimicrobiales bacterium]